MKACVNATFRAPKNSGNVFGSGTFQKICAWEAPSDLQMSSGKAHRFHAPCQFCLKA